MKTSSELKDIPAGEAQSGITALYSRVTREESVQKGLSLPNQKRRFNELAETHGWESTKIYEEPKGTSGELPPEQRPALSSLLADARVGKITRIVIRHLDRLGRGDVLVPVLQSLQSAGVEVMTFDGVIEVKSAAGRFMTRVQAAAGAFEVERGGERVREAKRGRAHDGIYTGPAPYGYTSQSRRCRELIATGLPAEEARIRAQREIPVRPGLIVDEAEAKIVRLVFDLYVNQRKGVRVISNELNSRGILRRGKKWVPQHITKLLRDPKVAGFVTYDEEAYKDGRKTKAAIHKQTRYPAKHEAIIDPKLFRKAEILQNEGRRRIISNIKNARIYPLGPVLCDNHGHRMKGHASEGIYAYYGCSVRRSVGPEPEFGGCDVPPIHAGRAEEAVRAILAELLSSPEMVMKAWESAKRKMAEDAPERKRALSELDVEIAGLEREREAAFAGLRDIDLDPDHYKIIANRAKELNVKIRSAQERRDEVEHKVVPVQVRRLSKKQVEMHLSGLQEKLGEDPARFRDLVIMLKSHHDLHVVALDNRRLRVSLTLKPGAIRGDRGQSVRLTAEAEPVINLNNDGETGPRLLTGEEWAARENERGHYCQCGCGQKIVVLPRHRGESVGIPKYIRGSGHWQMSISSFVEKLNANGWVTVGQAAREIGVSETTMRRAEDKGWIIPDWQEWGKKKPMRVYKKADLKELKEHLVEIGYRFKSDTDLMTTKEVAKKLNTSETRLRWLESKGKIPAPPRDFAGKRMWRRSELKKLKATIPPKRGKK